MKLKNLVLSLSLLVLQACASVSAQPATAPQPRDAARSSAEYHAIAQGLSDIYWQELNRAPDEGGWIEWFWHWRENARGFDWIREQVRQSSEWHAIHDAPAPAPAAAMQRLVNRNGFFAKANGERFAAIGASDFNLYGTYLILGEARTREIMAERSAIGFNMLRVWLAYWDTNTMQGIPGIGELNPAKFPDFYGPLPKFAGIAAEYGLYVEFTAFTGPHIPGHWDKIGQALRGSPNVLVELANENNAHAVQIDPTQYQKLPGILTSHGSNASQAIPPRPAWDYEVMHHVNVFEWQRKVAHNTMELTVGAEGIEPSRVPAMSNENTRPDQDGDDRHFYDAAASCVLLTAGCTFHSQSGKASFLFDERDRRFAQAWVAGARSVDLEFQDGRYAHPINLETSADLRVYQRILPDSRAFTVRVRR